ncbi:hypothetical protein BD310DRAFT_976708 [Dichomitus squalens]|uniref:Uncharacterized protein n=1 Tax=Dichomitus squalens TaxID=114155 RepID=A0A4Q9PX85_9APHY|nr:hypothetical protein BD310DRAFT_976708 [Dichomitus squalens]
MGFWGVQTAALHSAILADQDQRGVSSRSPVYTTNNESGDSSDRRHNENGVAVQIVGFFQQYLGIFKELQGKNLYLTGEGHAGMTQDAFRGH